MHRVSSGHAPLMRLTNRRSERDLIRLELMPRFGQDPDLANGLFLRTWWSGPQKDQPKIRKAIQRCSTAGW